MNLLYTLSWHGPSAEAGARELYDQLSTATTRSERFPFDCPYEVALAHQRATDGEWLVAILAMRGTILNEAERTETMVKLEDWFARSGAVGMRGGRTHPADHLKVSSELGLDYIVVESFGTFVGEPSPDDVEKKPEEKPEPVKATATGPASADLPPESLGQALARAAATTPPPPGPAIHVNPNTARSCGAWAGSGMIGLGGLVGLFSLLFALLMAIGAFAGETPETNLNDFFLALACIPLPMLLFAVIFIGVGIFVIVQARKKQPSTSSVS